MKRIRLDWIDYQGEGSDLASFISSSKTELLGWEIFFNQNIEEAEAWFVIEGSRHEKSSASIPPKMLFYGTGDTIWTPEFFNNHPWRLEFLKQFDQIHSCHNISLPTASSSIPFHHWMINANTGTQVISRHVRDYDFLVNLELPKKSKEISVICSTKAFTIQHAQRLRFVEGLKEHFGDRLDWFGNGKNPVSEKWDALVNYKYSIAIENKIFSDVVTEKILDPYLTYTFPIYHGAPNIAEYFSKDSLLLIDANDLENSILKIEQLLAKDDYASKVPSLVIERNKVLNEYNFIQRIVTIAESELRNQSSVFYEKREVLPMSDFQPLTSRVMSRTKGIVTSLRDSFFL